MKELTQLLCSGLFCIVFFISIVEYYRYEECWLRCENSALIHYKTASSSLCKKEDTRHAIEKEYSLCSKAEAAIERGLRGCTISLWWSEGEITLLYNRIFKEPLMLYGLLLPMLLYGMKQVFNYYSDKRRDATFFKEMEKRAAHVLPTSPVISALPPPTPPRYTSASHKLTNWERRHYKKEQQL